MRRYWDASLSSYGTYHYVLNAQGDVVQINYQGGTVKATYTYDAWGNPLTATGDLAAINPLRYRGYYYDTDTGFYYLQNRYYDPVMHRFINADGIASTGQGLLGYNMFAYCNNNPVCMADSEGTFPEYVIVDTSKTTTAEMITNDEGDTIYRTTITFYEKVTIKSFRWTIYESSYTHTRTYEYTVTNNGIIRFDNTQKHADDVTYSEIGLELSKEMLRVAREKLPGALEGRTEQGIENELCAHYLLSGINNHTKIADMGSSKKGAVGYDSNAWLFELF